MKPITEIPVYPTIEAEVNGVMLSGPEGFTRLFTDPAFKAKHANGCGPGSAKYDLIPDTIYGLSIVDACNIHDLCWDMCGNTDLEFDLWNEKFMTNISRIINAKSKSAIMRVIRRVRMSFYYSAVQEAGKDIFDALKLANLLKANAKTVLDAKAIAKAAVVKGEVGYLWTP